MSTATVHQLHPTDVSRVFDAQLAAELRRPFALPDLQFKIQGGRKDGGSEIVCYVDARAVAARLNSLCPGEWHTRTRALPPEMRPHRITDGHVEFIKTDRQGKASVDHSVQYECVLTIRGCEFEGIGAGTDSKAAHSDSLKRAAVRAHLGRQRAGAGVPLAGTQEVQAGGDGAGIDVADDLTAAVFAAALDLELQICEGKRAAKLRGQLGVEDAAGVRRVELVNSCSGHAVSSLSGWCADGWITTAGVGHGLRGVFMRRAAP